MRDHAAKWPPAPDWATAKLDRGSISLRTIEGLSQLLVSGDLNAWATASGIASESVAGHVIASGDKYSTRIARDRVLTVSATPLAFATGWHDAGFAISRIDAGMHVFQVEGPGLNELLARAMTQPLVSSGPSASLLFAGINVVLYHFTSMQSVRIHVDRALAPYLWEWLEQSV
ncbi:MAG: hypothetical protein R3D70_19865 [Rhizobiaceae bacterium]